MRQVVKITYVTFNFKYPISELLRLAKQILSCHRQREYEKIQNMGY